MIKFRNVNKSFGKNDVLKNISLTIPRRNLVTIIGASGCGKTTMLKMINRLIKPTSGEIFIDGENIRDKDVIRLRRSMGYVIQQTGLFSHMTVRENIEIIPKLSKITAEQIHKRTLELMDMVGMDPDLYLDRYPTELSGGQQQRIGVARAFATDPEIILMDEPFSALDPITRTQLQDELLGLQNNLNKTIVFVTHDMDEAVKIADKICIMKDGHILQYDEPEHILKRPCNDFVASFVGKNRIWASPEFIKAKDIMIERPICCAPELSLRKATERMRFANVDSLMVTDRKWNMLGVIRAKDLYFHLEHSHNPGVTIAQIMDTSFLHAAPEDSIIDVLSIVEGNNVSSVPILNPDGILQGLITRSSLMTTLSHQFLDQDTAPDQDASEGSESDELH